MLRGAAIVVGRRLGRMMRALGEGGGGGPVGAAGL
jgi:hypothetical protein